MDTCTGCDNAYREDGEILAYRVFHYPSETHLFSGHYCQHCCDVIAHNFVAMEIPQ